MFSILVIRDNDEELKHKDVAILQSERRRQEILQCSDVSIKHISQKKYD